MTREEAEEYAKNMTYRDAVYNALQGRAIPYRKVTLIKLHELLELAKKMDKEQETPQPKIGHWIFCEGIKGKDNVERCSCCQSHWKEAVIYSSDTQEYLRLRLKYCPNCGAKMQEVEE